MSTRLLDEHINKENQEKVLGKIAELDQETLLSVSLLIVCIVVFICTCH
jgi:hypothetical protein